MKRAMSWRQKRLSRGSATYVCACPRALAGLTACTKEEVGDLLQRRGYVCQTTRIALAIEPVIRIKESVTWWTSPGTDKTSCVLDFGWICTGHIGGWGVAFIRAPRETSYSADAVTRLNRNFLLETLVL
eukprot:GFKZ01008538.1.p3 GENE.GFKZ01008538.1~~GFKZ01008538.1.p3  ORF type:complete len:129 (-),score=5.64 GFKZ01008538.1:15-401(-)